MKRILITGKNSYIGNSFEEWISQWPDKYQITKISVRDDRWRNEDWSEYDALLHVAGIAHNSSNASMEELYYQVNRDLTYDIAKKAKNDGISHFVNMSSIIIFGTEQEEINSDTKPNPDNFYGDSKLQAELKLNKLIDENFKVSNVRTPMVYGRNSKGNFLLLGKLAKATPIFPNYMNKRSMIYIKNLNEYLRKVIDLIIVGNLYPQNGEFVCTSELVVKLAKAQKNYIYTTKLFNPVIKLLSSHTIFEKMFGSLFYSTELDDNDINYRLFNLEESIKDIYHSKEV
ncbi:NAD-dependent epimerase/dehydratase family protein [Aerococcus urinaeequi]|uniref:NAD-dependent epimerase/dehydratase family protein n=1 Tax=Aerococcus urinaeequi TaxID=51665 RepID=UPI003D6C0F81